MTFIEAEVPDDAMRLVSQVLNEDPNNPKALFMAGYINLKCHRFGLAYAMFKRASDIKPEQTQIWNNLSMAAHGCGLTEDAAKFARMALQRDPNNHAAMNNLALYLLNECRPDDAIRWADKSLDAKNDQPEAKETRGYAALLLGRWREGWAGYEASIHNIKHRTPRPLEDESYWNYGEGQKVLVMGEQGIGDEISFASCLPDMMKDNEVILECDKRLEGLFKRSFPTLNIYPTRFNKHRGWREDIDCHCLIGSLAAKYRNKTEDFPGTPYLVADEERRLQWRALLQSFGDKPKIGIAWTGGLKSTFESRRSLSVEVLKPILDFDATFVSLQYKPPGDEIKGTKIKHWSRATESQDYDDTAALVAELDLVITVQTAVAHLAGALGKECWVMVPSKPHWRYGLNGDKMPWYQSVRLFRQTNSWDGVIKQIAKELEDKTWD